MALTLADISARMPALEDKRNAEAAERARRARVQREMVLNETADGPTFVACDADGNPLDSKGTSDEDESDEPGSDNADNSGNDHSNGDQEIDQDYDSDLNQSRSWTSLASHCAPPMQNSPSWTCNHIRFA